MFDLVEAGGDDIDGDGMIDTFLDSDEDGVPDNVDVDQTGGDDSDSDGIDDQFDASITFGDDINNNGIDDSVEADPDGDGRGNSVSGDAPNTNSETDSQIVTGVNGAAGCTVAGHSASTDPTLLVLVLASLGGLFGRRRMKAQSRSGE